jgi:hypothetical protein
MRARVARIKRRSGLSRGRNSLLFLLRQSAGLILPREDLRAFQVVVGIDMSGFLGLGSFASLFLPSGFRDILRHAQTWQAE